MSLKQRIAEDLKQAMKARDAAALSALRLLKSAITNREIELGSDIDDSELLRLVEKQLKQRRESAKIYRQAGRSELAEKEEKEASVLQSYLPAQLAPEELDRVRRRHRIGLDFTLDDLNALAGWYGGTELFRTPETFEERLAKLEQVTPQQIQEVARRTFTLENLYVCAVGPAKGRAEAKLQKAVHQAPLR